MFFQIIISLVSVTVYAAVGSMVAFCVCGGYGFGSMEGYVASYLCATLIAVLLTFIYKKLLFLVFKGVNMHLIRQAYYMKVSSKILMLLMFFAVALNFRCLVQGLDEMFASYDLWKPVVAILTIVCLMTPFVVKEVKEWVHHQGFTMYDKLAVGMSVVTVTLLFSFEQTTALAGVPVVPLSVNYLAAVSLLGIAFAGRSYSIELKLYRQEGMALVLAPLGAFLITYVLLYLSWNRDDIMDFAIMSGAIVLLCGVYFFGYSRIQKRHSEAAERMLEVQRNQIYENSRVLSDMELKMVMAENQTLHDTVNMKRQEIMNVALSIVEQKEYLESLNTIVKQYSNAEDEEQRDRLINDMGVSLRQRLSYERDVDSQYFYAQAESLHEDFNAKLSENFPNLTQQERRLATLLRLGFSSKYIATLMNITPKSVEISRYRLRQKLGLERSDNLVNFIKSI